ncbi:hypothetical protein [Paracoccus mutanolyticus]|uniref:hypothetical protein n=1 Tax=Paracoccus mutanolyticus TaxID=1499308 RepID=UPI0011AEBA94|nr:hypothetical protein [Paracoccus mutanolyticus]
MSDTVFRFPEPGPERHRDRSCPARDQHTGARDEGNPTMRIRQGWPSRSATRSIWAASPAATMCDLARDKPPVQA